MLKQIIAIVKEASNLMKVDFEVKQKGNESDYVTTADVNIQRYLEKHLTALIDGSTFLGEEDGKTVIDSSYIWVVDPIDGTSNFVRDLMHSVISVGLVKDGTPYMGVIYNPYSDQMFWAERGKGAYMNGTKIHVSDRDFRHGILCTAASIYNKNLAKPCFNIMERVYHQADDFRRFGAAALEMAYLAGGHVELYFEMRLFPWDMAAAVVIMEEAGAAVEIIHEEHLPLDRPAGIIAANSKESLEKLREIVYEEIPKKLY